MTDDQIMRRLSQAVRDHDLLAAEEMVEVGQQQHPEWTGRSSPRCWRPSAFWPGGPVGVPAGELLRRRRRHSARHRPVAGHHRLAGPPGGQDQAGAALGIAD